MSQEKSQQQLLAEFYAQAQDTLEKLAEAHGLEAPKGAATIESGCLHWRLSVYAEPSHDYWARIWSEHASTLGLPSSVQPGDSVVDQQGMEWRLLGLDPVGGTLPVRVCDSVGKMSFISLAQAELLQKVG